MRFIGLSLPCLLIAAGCSEESAPADAPPPGPRSVAVTCTAQPELGDAWEVNLSAREIQRDADGNVYVIGSHAPACAPAGMFEGSWALLTKIGARGDVQWVRGWPQSIRVAVAPDGESMVVHGDDGVALVGPDGSILKEGRRGTGVAAAAAATNGFFVAGRHEGEEPITFDGTTFEPASYAGLFIIALDRQLVPVSALQPPPHNVPLSQPMAVAGLSNGDVVTLHHDELDGGHDMVPTTVITRSGQHPWRSVAPGTSLQPRLFVLDDDSIVTQQGSTMSRHSPAGLLLWSREYDGALNLIQHHRSTFASRGGRGFVLPTASDTELVIAFTPRSDVAIETSIGPVMPEGDDVGFATIDLDSGLLARVTLVSLPGDQLPWAPALAADGSLVIAIQTDPREGSSDTRLVRYASVP